MSDDIKEECGVFGAYNVKGAAHLTYQGIYALQHRGQESAGIATFSQGELLSHKGMGLISEVFKGFDFNKLPGEIAIGHNRYSTTGNNVLENAQPLCMECRLGTIGVAHNGNLINAEQIKMRLQKEGAIFQTSSDSEVIVHLLSKNKEKNLVSALQNALEKVKGAYCILVASKDKMIAVRDPNGFRPLVLGKLNGGYVVSSETCAFDLIRAEYIREIKPGEIVVFSDDGIESHFLKNTKKTSKCIFEYVYFSRPDSVIFGENCDKVRRQMGRQLAIESPVEADNVISVPDSSNTTALGYSEQSEIPFEIGLIRNHYVGRTFIKPDQSSRSFGVRLKFNPVKGALKDKRVILVDDSLVRGTTLKELIILLKQAGAKEIHVRIASAPVISPCYFGIDLSTKKELIAANYEVDQICQYIGADSMSYLSLKGMLLSAPGTSSEYCVGCFKGVYPVKPPKSYSKTRLG